MNRLLSPTRSGALRLSSALLFGCGTCALGMVPAAAQEAAVPAGARIFAIQPQPLVDAMREFSSVTGIQVAYAASIGNGVQSPGVSGSYSPAEALSRLLTGTRLTYRFTGPNAITLEPAPTADTGTVQLGPVRVEAVDEGTAVAMTSHADPAASEGTRSYAPRAVTVAGKTAQTPRDIPQSISVVTRERLDDQHLISLVDALRYTTGVTVPENGSGSPDYYARGYPLGIQYDGVPATNGLTGYAPQFDLAMYDRVEVLKGPAGLLQGSAEPAGTINLVRKRPLDRFAANAQLSVGSWNNVFGDLDVSTPLNTSGTIRARAVLAGQDRDFFYDDVHERHGLAYAIVEADPSPDTTLSLSGAIQHTRRSPLRLRSARLCRWPIAGRAALDLHRR